MPSKNTPKKGKIIDEKIYLEALELMYQARRMADLYDEEKEYCSRYVHSTSMGHEAIQLAAAFHLTSKDFAAPYYRDESLLMGIGFTPYELMLQLMAKRDDPFSGGRSYYSHPSVKRDGFPTIPHQSSATGMQAIPATGVAQGIKYFEEVVDKEESRRLILCSIGDGAITEGEVAEAFQMAVLHKYPILYLVQDNDWGISASSDEMRAMDAYEYAGGFKGLERRRTDGTNFGKAYKDLEEAFEYVRSGRGPLLMHAKCPLLGHHTSGVRKEWYRGEKNLELHAKSDPLPLLEKFLIDHGFSTNDLQKIKIKAEKTVSDDFEKAKNSPDPDNSRFDSHILAPTPIVEEKGIREPKNAETVVMVDAALHAVDEILAEYPEALLYGQDVGERIGGVFREAATLAKKYGKKRVFNTPIQEAYIVGSTAGMSAVGAKPIVEIQFADYIWPGINQLVEELSKSCYLSVGKFPISSVIRVPIGAYGGGGPYHSGSIESTLANIRGIKVVYPSCAADMKGLMKAAYFDPNPVVVLEHKGLYWSKVPGTTQAKTKEPDKDYIIPIGKGRIVREATPENVDMGKSTVVITYGMGVHWALNAEFRDQVEILDLRSINPIDWNLILERVKIHNKVLVLTEEPLLNSFAESIAGRISSECFADLDAPVMTLGAANLPAIPLNRDLEAQMLPNAEKLSNHLRELLEF